MEYKPFLDAFKYSLAPTELQDRWNELDSYVYVISNRWDQKPATDKDRHLDPQWADSDEHTIVFYWIYRIYLFVSDERQPSVSQLKEVNSLPFSFLVMNGHSVDDFYQWTNYIQNDTRLLPYQFSVW